ncbi:uncharacterized protein [Ptychodera flava]|uniref:uncharacterized protein n=1 Tax=Ptychodera flava TaxID=63121 RepID=UPI003969CC32
MHMAVFNEHKVMELNEFLMCQCSKERGVYCNRHKTELLELYCNECDEAFCMTCQDNLHGYSGHHTLPLTMAVPKLPTVVGKLVENAKKLAKESLPKAIHETSMAKLLLKQRLERAQMEVQEMTECQINLIKEKEEETLCELEGICANKMECLDKEEKRLRENSHQLQNTWTAAEEILKYANNTELLAMKDTLVARLTEVNRKEFSNPSCNLRDETALFFKTNMTSSDLSQIRESFGDIQQSLVSSADVYADGDGLYSSVVGQQETVVIKTRCEYISGLINNFSVHLENHMRREEPVELLDDVEKNGTYKLVLCPQIAGKYKLYITLFKKHIRGSPFCIQVHRKSCSEESDAEDDSGRREKSQASKTFGKERKQMAQRGRVDKSYLLKIRDWIQSDQCSSSNVSPGHRNVPVDTFDELPRGGTVGLNSISSPVAAKTAEWNSTASKVENRDDAVSALVPVKDSEPFPTITENHEGPLLHSGRFCRETCDSNENAIQSSVQLMCSENWDSDNSSAYIPLKSEEKLATKTRKYDLNENYLQCDSSVSVQRNERVENEWDASGIDLSRSNCLESSQTNDTDWACLLDKRRCTSQEIEGDHAELIERKEDLTHQYGEGKSCENSLYENEKSGSSGTPSKRQSVNLSASPCSSVSTMSSGSSRRERWLVKKPPNSGPLRKPSAACLKQSIEKDDSGDIYHLTVKENDSTKEEDTVPMVPDDDLDLDNMIGDKCDVSAALVQKFGSFGKEHGCLRFPLGICVTLTGDHIVTDNANDRVEVFSPGGAFKYSLGKFGQFSRPSAVLVTKLGDIVVKDRIKLHMFSSDGVFLRSFGSMLKSPYGLAIDGQGQIVTLDISMNSCRIFVFDLKGSVRSCKPFEPVMDLSFHKCRFLDVYEDRVIVSDLGNNAVYITTLEGKLLRKFGQKGMGPGQFNEPSGVTVDSKGNILVADSKNDRIQAFRLSGDFIGYVTCQGGVKRPSDILLTKDRHLMVVSFLGHCVKKFRL